MRDPSAEIVRVSQFSVPSRLLLSLSHAQSHALGPIYDETRAPHKKHEKNSTPRIFKVGSKLIDMLNALPKTDHRVLGGGPTWYRKSPFFRPRKLVARKLQNPLLLRISFHTLRHWKATMLYHETKDPLHEGIF